MSIRLLFLLVLQCVLFNKLIAQENIPISLIDKNQNPIPYAFAITQDRIIFSNAQGQLYFKDKPQQLEIHARNYKSKTLKHFQWQITLEKSEKKPKNAHTILSKVFKNVTQNNPYQAIESFGFKRYNRTLIQRNDLKNDRSNENLFLERSSEFLVKNDHEKELVLAQKNQGFDEPVLNVLSHRMHDINWYAKTYVIFETDYVSPLYAGNAKAYKYEIIHEDERFYYIFFSPNIIKADRLLQGVMCIDKNYALAKIYANKDDEVKLDLVQSYFKNSDLNLWLTNKVHVKMTPGKGGKSVSLFGTNVNFGTLQNKSIAESDKNNELLSTSIFYDHNFNKQHLNTNEYDVLVDKEAHQYHAEYWKSQRKIPLSEKDSLFFEGVSQTLQRQNTIDKINKLENVNNGFFPILKWKTDLKTLIKLNNYEGLRLGIGGLTNEEFSENFRVGGYIAYGTKDKTIKFGLNTGFLLNKDSNMWLNAEYTDDVREVGSNAYLTDERVYSLFEPRLVNIIFFYKEKTASLSLQKRITPRLLSEFKIAYDRVFQTENYAYLNGDIALSSYDLSRALLSLRWSPKSKFLKFDNNFITIKEHYPVVSGQIEQYFGQTFGGDLSFTKLNLKGTYVINHINTHQTEFSLEGNYAFGDVPLTHSFHAFPNAPNKPTILDRFSVAGVKSFETMFFSEFFSTRLASLHIKHHLAPFKISNTFRPEMVLISRHAIGNFSNQNRHMGIEFNTLNKGYSEAGLELNKLFWGFGLSFAYRYGAYHLPVFEDNIAFKFTFNLKI